MAGANPGHALFFVYAWCGQRSVPPWLHTDGNPLDGREAPAPSQSFPDRVLQTVVGRHKLEAAYLWKSIRPVFRPAATQAEASKNLEKGDELRCGTTRHHPKPVVVVAVVRMVVVAGDRTHVVLVIVPRTAAQDTPVNRCSQVQLPAPMAKCNKEKGDCLENF